jgi:hypothetical protein
VRRTSSIDIAWPEGRAGRMQLVGRARDAVTPRSGGAPIICAEDGCTARLTPDRTIAEIAAEPARPELAQLVGARAGGGLRQAVEAAAPEERRRATPLHLILDDIAGASLVAAWGWSLWDPDWLAKGRAVLGESAWAKRMAQREGICIGFAPGSSALEDNATRGGVPTPAPDLRNPTDPEGWHAFPDQDGLSFRRARRIDVTADRLIRIDAGFQDSATTPDGGRAVVHEYTLSAAADPQTLRLVSLQAEPQVLPHRECPSAVGNLDRLIGASLPELRERVLAELAGAAGCTHLNDALRALAEAPALVERLRGALGETPA